MTRPKRRRGFLGEVRRELREVARTRRAANHLQPGQRERLSAGEMQARMDLISAARDLENALHAAAQVPGLRSTYRRTLAALKRAQGAK